MSRSITHRSGQVGWDGKSLAIFPISRMQNAAAVVYGLGFSLPYAAKVVALNLTIAVQFTHASSAIAFGIPTDLDSVLDDYPLQNVAVGTYEVSNHALMLSRDLNANTAYTFSLASADTTGSLYGSIVLEPAG